MANFYRDLVAILRAHGCRLVRQGKGSHEVWYSPVNGRYVTVPRSTKSRHTANEVLRQAGLPKAFWPWHPRQDLDQQAVAGLIEEADGSNYESEAATLQPPRSHQAAPLVGREHRRWSRGWQRHGDPRTRRQALR